jgi:hypothetical protein
VFCKYNGSSEFDDCFHVCEEFNLYAFLVFVIYTNKFYILISSCHGVSSRMMFVQNNGNKI